ncbi:MAG: cell division protein FtsA [Rhodospirillales bacterium]|nr:cell division protein FtsA [Rhodospirillales bacterium]
MYDVKHRDGARNGLIAALDIGTTKIACFIARPDENGSAEVIGIGHQISKGVRNGNIVDMDAVEAAITATVEDAEELAQQNVQHLVLSISGGDPQSRLISFDVSIAGHEIGDNDLRRALDPTWLYARQSDDRRILHTLPIGYSINGCPGVRDPRRMFGEKLGVKMHVVTADASAMRNLDSCISRCHLTVESLVAAPYASGLSSLVDDEKEMGAICIDMGGGTTGISMFVDGEVIHTDCIPLGGTHVTSDIARGLSTPIVHAERMKNLLGSVIPSPKDDEEFIKIPLVGEEDRDENEIPRSILVGIIRPRLEEIFEMARAKIEDSGVETDISRRVILTGGASQLNGVRQLAAETLNKHVRLGQPAHFKGLAESTNGPAYATSAGLIQFALNERAERAVTSFRSMEVSGGRFGRIGQWLRERI